MADDADRAQVINDQFQADMITSAQINNASGMISRRFCKNCEEPIPEARREAMPGCDLCINCQQEQEAILSNWRAL